MSSAWTLTGALLLGGCTQQHLSIGALDGEEAAVDAGTQETVRDASAQTDSEPRADASDSRAAEVLDATTPLDVKLRVFGREDVATLRAGCGAGCADFDVITRGGTPPYQTVWIDGDTASTRTFCPGADELTLGLTLQPQVTVSVTDSRAEDAGSAWAETSIFLDGCDAGVSGWELCMVPVLVPGVACQEESQKGLWFALEEPVEGAEVSVSATIAGATLLTSTPVELWLAGEACGLAVHAGEATINAVNTNARGSATVRGARFVLLRGLDAMPGLSVSDLRVCLRQ